MRKYLWLCLAMLAMALTSRPVLAQEEDLPDIDGSIALAERFAGVAHQNLLVPSRAVWRQSAAMLEAACKLNPKESRYPRFLADIYTQLNDVTATKVALKAYISLIPDDEVAQAQLIDLYLREMESVDKRIKYCNDLLVTQAIPPQVRSHVAFRCAQYLMDQSQLDAAVKMTETSLVLSNHLNLDALRLKWDLTAPNATPLDRVGLLLSMARSNPSDPAVLTQLAQQAANVGLINESILWYNAADYLYSALQMPRDGSFVRGFAGEMVLAGHPDEALALLNAYLKVAPDDGDAWFLAISIQQNKALEDKDKPSADNLEIILRQAGIGLSNRFTLIRQAIGVTGPTTRPMDAKDDDLVAALSLGGDYDLLQKSGDAALIDAYINAASDLAWYKLYYKHDSSVGGADGILSVLDKLLGDSDLVLARLRAWNLYVTNLVNKTSMDETVAKLTAIADRDPYAQLGLFLINQVAADKKDKNTDIARKMLNDHPAGALGAILWEAVRSTGATVGETSTAGPIAAAMGSFPIDFFRIIREPSFFYAVRIEPTKPAYEFGEPIMIRVRFINLNNYDLTIGANGTIRPDLWLDARMKGSLDAMFTGIAFDQMGRRLVLKKGESISTLVRADIGPLTSRLDGNPGLTILMNMMVCTNPIPQPPADPKKRPPNEIGPQAEPGPAGYRVQTNPQFLQRTAVPFTDPQKMLTQAKSGTGGEKIRAMYGLFAMVSTATLEAKADPKNKVLMDAMTAQIRRNASDPSLSMSVRTWAKYLNFLGESENEAKQKDIEAMVDSPDWTDRLWCLQLLPVMSDHGVALATKLSADTDPIISACAKASVIVAQTPTTLPSGIAPPTTLPTTAPAH